MEDSNFNAGAEIIDWHINSGRIQLSDMIKELLSRKNFRFEPLLRDYFHERIVETGLEYNRVSGVYETPQ